VCFISPYRQDRKNAGQIIGDIFNEIFVKCDIEECRRRDPKGLYKKADAGEIKEFTGVSDPYEEPANPALVVDSSAYDAEECARQVVKWYDA
jgi:adenylylsulfate kinase-like enzyme